MEAMSRPAEIARKPAVASSGNIFLFIVSLSSK
jgi:hypothetical protein